MMLPRSTQASNNESLDITINGYVKKQHDYLKLDQNTQAGLAEIQGFRENQEDQLQVTPLENFSSLSQEERKEVFMETMATMQNRFGDEKAGSTACIATAWIDEKNEVNAVSANLGDSTAYIVIVDKTGYSQIKQLNKLHNTDNNVECERITQNGKRLITVNKAIEGVLLVTRAIGDKYVLTEKEDHIPEVEVMAAIKLESPSNQKAFLVIACDGLTERGVLDDAAIANIVYQYQDSPPHAAHALIKQAYEAGSTDNISVAVVPISGNSPVSAAVFDGHGGDKVSKNLGEHFYSELKNNVRNKLDKKNQKDKTAIHTKSRGNNVHAPVGAQASMEEANDKKVTWNEGRRQGDSWIFYNLNSPSEQTKYSDKYKVHVSIDQEQLEKANDLIIPILKRYQIHKFKMLSNKDQFRNTQGKELVIYLQKKGGFSSGADEKNPNLWIDLFNEIESTLTAVGIGPNQKFQTQGDKLFPGSRGFIYYRYPNNVIDRYVSSDSLTLAGLTKEEAYNLSGKTKFDEWFTSLSLHSSNVNNSNNSAREKLLLKNLSKINISSLHANDNDYINEKNTIKDIFEENVMVNTELFFGASHDNYQIKLSHEKLARLFKTAFGYTLSEYYVSEAQVNLPELQKEVKELKYFYEDCLEKSAHYVALIREELNLRELLGDITPAVYQHFYLPLMKAWKTAEKANNPLPLAMRDIENIVNKDAFIEAIIKCTFRDKDANQLENDKPIYIANLDEEKIEKHLQEIQLRYASKETSTETYIPVDTNNNANANTNPIQQKTGFNENSHLSLEERLQSQKSQMKSERSMTIDKLYRLLNDHFLELRQRPKGTILKLHANDALHIIYDPIIKEQQEFIEVLSKVLNKDIFELTMKEENKSSENGELAVLVMKCRDDVTLSQLKSFAFDEVGYLFATERRKRQKERQKTEGAKAADRVIIKPPAQPTIIQIEANENKEQVTVREKASVANVTWRDDVGDESLKCDPQPIEKHIPDIDLVPPKSVEREEEIKLAAIQLRKFANQLEEEYRIKKSWLRIFCPHTKEYKANELRKLATKIEECDVNTDWKEFITEAKKDSKLTQSLLSHRTRNLLDNIYAGHAERYIDDPVILLKKNQG